MARETWAQLLLLQYFNVSMQQHATDRPGSVSGLCRGKRSMCEYENLLDSGGNQSPVLYFFVCKYQSFRRVAKTAKHGSGCLQCRIDS